MIVTIQCKLSISSAGVTIRHECADADQAGRHGSFGIPTRKDLSDQDSKVVLQDLPHWILARFRIEAEAAIRRAQGESKP